MRIYLTHCTGIKDNSLKSSKMLATPDQLYLSVPIHRFMAKCKMEKVEWAIFSDKYGIWFPNVKRQWYDKHPDTVTKQEFAELVVSFDENLKDFSEIWFYNNPSWFHSFYQRIISGSKLNSRIRKFSHLQEIKK